jgi:hypothetical protein
MIEGKRNKRVKIETEIGYCALAFVGSESYIKNSTIKMANFILDIRLVLTDLELSYLDQ